MGFRVQILFMVLLVGFITGTLASEDNDKSSLQQQSGRTILTPDFLGNYGAKNDEGQRREYNTIYDPYYELNSVHYKNGRNQHHETGWNQNHETGGSQNHATGWNQNIETRWNQKHETGWKHHNKLNLNQKEETGWNIETKPADKRQGAFGKFETSPEMQLAVLGTYSFGVALLSLQMLLGQTGARREEYSQSIMDKIFSNHKIFKRSIKDGSKTIKPDLDNWRDNFVELFNAETERTSNCNLMMKCFMGTALNKYGVPIPKENDSCLRPAVKCLNERFVGFENEIIDTTMDRWIKS